MKNKILAASAWILLLSVCFACGNSGDLEVSVVDNDDTYAFFAKYDGKKTKDIRDFINGQIKPARVILDEEITVTLNDKTEFELKESDQKIRIRLDKVKNSAASYDRVKELCNGIKEVIMKK